MTNSVSTYVAVPRPIPHADPVPDRDENELDGVVLVTDRGVEHSRNEDAGAVGTISPREGEPPSAIAAVVCDGVSTSADAQNASRAASVAGVDAMLNALAASADVTPAMVAGLINAAKAAAESTPSEGVSPASCTYTAVVVVPAPDGAVQIAVANVGDSRVYWVPEPPAQPQLLTVDDTVAQQLISAGIPPDSPAVLRGEHTLTRWFGRDADRESWDESKVSAMTTAEAGVLVLCSDGLHNYLPEAVDIAEFCRGTTPHEAALSLVDHALRAGGHDNITVVIIPIGTS